MNKYKSPLLPKSLKLTERVRQNIEEGKGFRLLKKNKQSGEFDFATSNELWRATLETLDFLPLTTADYGGGIIITY